MAKTKKKANLDLSSEKPKSGPKEKVAPGTYPALVSDSKITKSKSDNIMLVLEFNIIDGKFQGEKLASYNVLEGPGAHFTKDRLLAFHDEDELDHEFEVDAQSYLGQKAYIDVDQELYDHPEHTNPHRDDGKFISVKVENIFSFDDEEAAAGAEETLAAYPEEDDEEEF